MIQSILSKILQSDQFSNLMQNEALMKLVLGALEASMNLKGKLDETSAQILQKFSLVHQSEVDVIQAQVSDLESQVESLKNQIQVLIKEKQASQQIIADLKAQQEKLAQISAPTSTQTETQEEFDSVGDGSVDESEVVEVKWNAKMNKTDLLKAAELLGITGLSQESKKQEIIDALKNKQ
jgi:hypothetical protein